MKYDSKGSVLWTSQQGSSGDDSGKSLTVDKISGNILVAGYVAGSINGKPYAGGAADIILMEFSSADVVLTTRLTGSSRDDYGYGVSVVNGGAAYIAG